jgi:hypothetical protein
MPLAPEHLEYGLVARLTDDVAWIAVRELDATGVPQLDRRADDVVFRITHLNRLVAGIEGAVDLCTEV